MDASTPAHSDPVQTNITAQTGGAICTPILHGNIFHNQVVFNIHGAQESSSSSTAQAGSSVTSPVLKEELITAYKQKLKVKLQKKFQKITEGISSKGNETHLNEVYTNLYITEGGSGEVNNEHEVRHIELSRRRPTQGTINCSDIFQPLPGQDKVIRTVLTSGVAGIGKTVSVQKFILDWTEEKTNQDITFMFPLPFRELNLMKTKRLSLMNLLHRLFPEAEALTLLDSEASKVVFIFDGLDECRLPLDFHNNESLFSITESASVDVLLTNLINGNLLPSAFLWITSRPAAASQIPSECIDQVTEIQGFTDPQKEEYFRKKISDQSLAERIITHIKASRSLYIMCHLPVFCWIAATVLEEMLSQTEREEIPKTLTQMFIYFLNFQIKRSSQKYQGKCVTDSPQTRKNILALGKLAFQQLEKGNLIFYEEDLRECGFDVREMSVYSGVYTQIFREEFEIERLFTFVHLSIQEFLAALYAFLSFILNSKNILKEKATGIYGLIRKSSITKFLNATVDKALQSENGHLDLFLRFLLGLSVESNQTLLRGLLPQTADNPSSTTKTIKYIKKKIRENSSPEKSINLFHCLNELKDNSLVEEVQTYLNRRGDDLLSGAKLTPSQWSALVFVLLNSEQELDEFDLSKYNSSEECLQRLLPVVKASTKAVLSHCNLTEKSCGFLASALSSKSTRLRKLDLSGNKLEDSGVKLLSVGLKSPDCKLEILGLEHCGITNEGFAALIVALKSNPSHLRELNLSHSKPDNSGVKELSGLLEDPLCKLEKLQLCNCSIGEEGCAVMVKALKTNPSLLRELNLNWNKIGDSGVNRLSDLLENSHCKLEKLQLECCSITDKGCAALVKALKADTSHVRELNLNYNRPGESGVKELSDLLQDPNCKLEKLHSFYDPLRLEELKLNSDKLGDSGVQLLSDLLEDPQCKLKKIQLADCNLTGESCIVLASALRSNFSNLTHLALSYNKLQNSGVQCLSAGLENPHCKLEILILESCNLTDKSCVALASALGSKFSSLKDLKLSYNQLRDSGVKLLSAGLESPHCKLEKLNLSDCSLTEKSCAVLASALCLKFSSLKNLDISMNEVNDSGVKPLSAALKNPCCKLENLVLVQCGLTDECCAYLASALSSNSSLRKLNLSVNYLDNSGVKLLSTGLENPHCKLEQLWLAYCFFKKEGCAALVLALIANPSHIRDLRLSHNNITDSGVKLLSVLLEDPQCKLEELRLYDCNLTEKCCAVLASALSSNFSSLKQLTLGHSKLQDGGVKLLSAGLTNPNCKLETLELPRSCLTVESCAILASALSSNSSLRELDLSGNDLQDSGIKLLTAALENPNSKLESLKLENCGFTEEGCAAVVSAVKSSPIHLKELNLNFNKPGESVVKELSGLLEDPHCKLEKLHVEPYLT